MKITFDELKPGECFPSNIEIATALIKHKRLFSEDLEEIAQYLNTYVEYARRPRPCYGESMCGD